MWKKGKGGNTKRKKKRWRMMRGAWGQNGLIHIEFRSYQIIYHLSFISKIYKNKEKEKEKEKNLAWVAKERRKALSLFLSRALVLFCAFFLKRFGFCFYFCFRWQLHQPSFSSLSLSSARDADSTLSLSSTQREKNIFIFNIYFSEESIVENA